jgi:hypothetical protein
MTGGAHLSEREEKGEVTGSGERGVGPRADSSSGPNGSPGPFNYFLFFLFLFFISFITFSFVLQIHSNQFLKFSKIHLNILRQLETCFHN